MDERQQRRVAANESAFRDANERVRKAIDEFVGNGHAYEIMCECAVTECEDMIEISRADYEYVRSDPTWFAVLPNHLLPATQNTVEKRDRYWIIEKIGAGAQVARERAPD